MSCALLLGPGLVLLCKAALFRRQLAWHDAGGQPTLLFRAHCLPLPGACFPHMKT